MKEYTGNTLDEILEDICLEQRISKDDITYEIIDENKESIRIQAYTKKDIKDFMYDYMMNYFDGIEIDVDIEIEEEDENFYKLTLNAHNNAILIGRNGQTLQAINHVLKAAVSGEFKTKISVLVDVNGYKSEKYRKECAVAARVAKSVQKTKMDALLDPMPNDERKVIHNYLADWKHIQTISEGEGNQRRIKICYVDQK